MSDLAPLVAAVLHDKVVLDMRDEIEELYFSHQISVANSIVSERYAFAKQTTKNCQITEGDWTHQRMYEFRNNPNLGITSLSDLCTTHVLMTEFQEFKLKPLGEWETGQPRLVQQQQQQQQVEQHDKRNYYHVNTRSQCTEFAYPEMTLEFQYAANQRPSLRPPSSITMMPGTRRVRENQARYENRQWWGFFHDVHGRVLDPPPTVRFLSVKLHEPQPGVLEGDEQDHDEIEEEEEEGENDGIEEDDPMER